MLTDIGAGAVFKMCTAANPSSALTGGNDSHLADVSANVKSVPIENAAGAEDITTLASAALRRAKSYLQQLYDPKVSTSYIDNAQGTFFLPAQAVRDGTLHPDGPGLVDCAVFIGGEVVGNMRADFTAIILDLPFGVTPENAYGGNLNFQITNGIVWSTQS